MKQNIFFRVIVAIAMMLICWLPSLAHDFEVNGIYYELINKTNKTVAVTYKGEAPYDYPNEYAGNIVIPSSVKYNGTTYSVTSIGGSAFEGCKSLTSIEIPNSVTSIGSYAFSDCSRLTSVVIPNSVTGIEYYAFYGCTGLTSVVIGNSVTSIGNYAFDDCSSLTSIEIPDSVTSIGDEAFRGCSSLTSIVVDAGNTKYDSRNECNAIIETALNTLIAGCKNTIIPNSVTSIGDYAFYFCSGLTSIEIPNSVTSIGSYAFAYCSSLTSAVIGNGVTSIGNEAFYGCSSLTSIEIPNRVTSIGDAAFAYCSSLTDVVIGNSVTSIGDEAFQSCSSLTSIEIPNSVISIGDYAFSDCKSLTSIEIPNSVISIGDHAFDDCKSLTSIEIPNSVTSIGDGAFYWCKSLTNVVIGNSVTSIGDGAFKTCSKLTSIEIPSSVTSIGGSAFFGCSSLTDVVIGNSVTSIGDEAFANCSSLTSVIWNSVRCSDFSYYGRAPFYGCNITSLTFGENVEHIPTYLCYNLSKLTNIEIPNSVTSIGDEAFRGCSSLTSAVIGNGVTSIGDSAFRDCSSLTSVVWNVKKCSDFYFDYTPFRSCPNITSFTFGDEVEHIPAYLCYNLSKLPSIQIPNSVTSIGDGAFDGCESLTSIEIGNSVTSIGDKAFAVCDSLTSVVWNVKKCSDFKNLENRPFKANNITSFTFGDEVEHIPAYLCYRMENLTNIEIPNSVISIGESAFSNGERLIIAVLGNSLTSIEKDAFKGCDNIKKIESKATKAPTIENEDQFSENVYANADLFVPIGYEDNYKYAYAWSEFHNIKGKDFSVKATSISLDKNEVSLKPTQTVVLTETIQPYDTSNKKVTWSSSDDNIAKVDTNGLVIAIAVGEATITATTTDGSNLSATCKVTVVPTLAEIITLDKTEISFEATETATLVATVLPELTTNKSVTWKSSNEAIATVDANGKVTAVAVGEATITATTTDGSNLSATCKVTVVATLAETIALDKTEISLEATETATLVATVLPELTTNKSVTWTSSNEAVATVDANGVVTAIALGEAVITATTTDGSNLSAYCKVIVVPTLAVSIEVTPNSVEAEENSEVQLSVNILPENATYKSVEWSSSNDAIASVNANGLVKIYKEGNVVITATTTDGSNLSATCRINVYSGIDGVNGDDVIVATIGDNIVVKNAKLGSVVNVYLSNGALIKSMTATDGSVVIEAPIKGIYVITIDGKSFKVMVK